MSLPFAPDPSALPMNVLFPEQYRETRRMIVRDFAILGTMLVVTVVGFCYLFA